MGRLELSGRPGAWTRFAARSISKRRTEETSTAPRLAPDLVLDRVGPDPFDPTGLGAITTVRWSVRLKSTTGTARLWLPEPVVNLVIAARAAGVPDDSQASASSRTGPLSSLWRAEAGNVVMPQGLKRLRTGGVLPLADSRLSGTPQSPAGPISLVCDLSDSGHTQSLPRRAGRRVRGPAGAADRPREIHPRPRHALPLGINQDMNATTHDPPITKARRLLARGLAARRSRDPDRRARPGQPDASNRLADLKPGDVIELGRHSREPVELTSSGRLVARGELVLIDTELGVRVTHVFLVTSDQTG